MSENEDKKGSEGPKEEKIEEKTVPVESPKEDVKKPEKDDSVGKAYDLVEIAKSTGKVKKGANEVTKCIERSEAKIVVIAEDTKPPEILMHFEPLCKEREITLVRVPSKKELGTSAGLEVPCSAIAIIDAGEAKDILMELRKKD